MLTWLVGVSCVLEAINDGFGENIEPLTDTEILESILQISPSMPFDSWAADFGLPSGQDGEGDDPDLDGVENLVECAFRMHPLKPDSDQLPSPSVTVNEGVPFLTMSYRPRAQHCPFISVVPQRSEDLENWTAIDEQMISAPDSNGTTTVRVPLTGTVYVRLLVTVTQ